MLQVPLEVIHTLGVLGLLAEGHVRLALASQDGLVEVDTAYKINTMFVQNTKCSADHRKQSVKRRVTYIMDHDVKYVRHVTDGSLHTGLGYTTITKRDQASAASG